MKIVLRFWNFMIPSSELFKHNVLELKKNSQNMIHEYYSVASVPPRLDKRSTSPNKLKKLETY
jgi:hypothetical protein